MRTPDESRSSRKGSASAPGNNEESEGPIARMITFFGWVPVIIKPPIRTLSPVSTRRRVEMLPKVPGVIIGVVEGLGVGVAEGLGVGVAEGFGVGVAEGLGVGVATGVGVGLGVGTGVG